MFIQFSGKCGQKHEIHFLGSLECSWMFIMFMFLSIISCFCPHFPENCMNIFGFTWMFISRLEIFIHNFMFLSTFSRKLYEYSSLPRKCGQFYLSVDNIVYIFWEFVWTLKSTQKNMSIRVYIWIFKWTQKVFFGNLVSKLVFEWVLEMFRTLKHKFASWKPGIMLNSFAEA